MRCLVTGILLVGCGAPVLPHLDPAAPPGPPATLAETATAVSLAERDADGLPPDPEANLVVAARDPFGAGPRPVTWTPGAAYVPEVPPPRVAPTTSGTCVGTPSVTAHKKSNGAACCYISPSYFREHVRARADAMRACYEDAVARRPTVHGRIVARFTIEESGLVTQACDAGSNVEDPELVRCVLAAFTSVTFEAYEVGFCPAMTISYPMQFGPDD